MILRLPSLKDDETFFHFILGIIKKIFYLFVVLDYDKNFIYPGHCQRGLSMKMLPLCSMH